jgi:hypothetical protein
LHRIAPGNCSMPVEHGIGGAISSSTNAWIAINQGFLCALALPSEAQELRSVNGLEKGLGESGFIDFHGFSGEAHKPKTYQWRSSWAKM